MTASILNLNEFNTVELGFNELEMIDGGDRSPRTWLLEAGVFVVFGPLGVAMFEIGYSL